MIKKLLHEYVNFICFCVQTHLWSQGRYAFFTYWSGKNIYFLHLKARENQEFNFRKMLWTLLRFYEISGQIYGLISSFLSNRRLRVVQDGNLYKNIQLMLEFLKGPFLVLHFFYYTLMTSLTMLSVILLSMLMILLLV